jgi:hypothetical protein
MGEHTEQGNLISLKIMRGCNRHRQQGDLISLLTKVVRGYMDRCRQICRELGDLISLLLFFQNKERTVYVELLTQIFGIGLFN